MPAQDRLRIGFIAGFIFLLTAASALSAPAVAPRNPRNQRHEYRHQIDRLEEAWRKAMVSADSAALEPLLAEDYTAITPNGAIQTKEQTLKILSSGLLHVDSLIFSDRKVRIYGSTAVVTSSAELTGNKAEQALTGRYRYTRVYVRNAAGQWKIVSFEASRIQDSAERQ